MDTYETLKVVCIILQASEYNDVAIRGAGLRVADESTGMPHPAEYCLYYAGADVIDAETVYEYGLPEGVHNPLLHDMVELFNDGVVYRSLFDDLQDSELNDPAGWSAFFATGDQNRKHTLHSLISFLQSDKHLSFPQIGQALGRLTHRYGNVLSVSMGDLDRMVNRMKAQKVTKNGD